MPNIPASNITIVDPGLGVTTPAQMRPIVMGVTSAGTANVLNFYSSPAKLVAEMGYGPAVEDALQILAYAGGPVGIVKMASSVAATNGAITKSGAGPVITLAGAAVFDFSAIVEITLAGALGVGKFRYTLDAYAGDTLDERTYSGTITIPAGGNYLIPGTGITLTFPSGTYVLAENYSWASNVASFNGSDVTAALTAINASPFDWRFLLLSASALTGNAATTAALLATIQSSLATQEANERFRAAMAPTAGDRAASVASVVTAYASTVANRELIAHGWARYAGQYPLPGRAYVDRPAVVSFAARAAGSLISTDLKRVIGNGLNDGGPLPGIIKLFFDERVDASLLDDIYISTLRTFDGRPGKFITQARMKIAAGSDFTGWHRRMVMDVACETAHSIAVTFIGRGVRTNPVVGTIDERDALRLESEVINAVNAQLVSPLNAEGSGGHVSAVSYRIDRTINILATSTIQGDLGILPLGSVDYILTRVGYSLNAGAETAGV